jgi:hypothetical protein
MKSSGQDTANKNYSCRQKPLQGFFGSTALKSLFMILGFAFSTFYQDTPLQAAEWHIGGQNWAIVYSIDVDSTGNIYGNGWSSAQKIGPDGQQLWEKYYDTMIPGFNSDWDYIDSVTGIAVIPTGGFYLYWLHEDADGIDPAVSHVTRFDADGNFISDAVEDAPEQLDFQGNKYISFTDDTGILTVSRFNADDGSMAWVKTYVPGAVAAGASSIDHVKTIVAHGLVVVVATIEFIDPQNPWQSVAPRNIFVMELLSSTGAELWINPVRLGDSVWNNDIDVHSIAGVDGAIDSDFNVYVTGKDHIYHASGPTSADRPYWVKLGILGGMVWEKIWGVNFDIPEWRASHPLYVEVDHEGKVFTANAGDAVLLYPQAPFDSGAFVAKYDGTPALQWAAPTGSRKTTSINQFLIDQQGNNLEAGV